MMMQSFKESMSLSVLYIELTYINDRFRHLVF